MIATRSAASQGALAVPCPYCGELADYEQDSCSVYHGRDFGPIYVCHPCQAWVGCHKGTVTPLGRLANAELRKWKMAAHAALDPLWKTGKMKRGEAYWWLSQRLGISVKDCHIGMFDVETCMRVIHFCTKEQT